MTSSDSLISSIYDPASAAATRTLLAELGAAPNRTLGQNFLINRGVLDRIVETASVSAEDAVLEVGPGLGALTCRLVSRAGQVAAIEKDAQFISLLQRHLPAPNFHLVPGDALQVAWSDLHLPETHVKVVANLPYFISKPMLRRLLEDWRPHLQSATLTVQREVADRIAAPPNTSAYGPMAIMTQLYASARRVFDISPGSFLPPPAVTSSVVHIQIKPAPSVHLEDERVFWNVVRVAFGQRRKQLGKVLQSIISDKTALASILETQSINPQRRGETLNLEEFARLSNYLATLKSEF
ncbi:MAG: 16S rRNA (adenine(1518)-N(6)/adenine(1519)-N(6))-dimethyltransferase RsmA [Abitibacteriaceae bacterium]|nr:16S rRNA (adenine(1518)-N(6)/adenine(1519)-N(6))-dimethyltransferase RsmA [Abditibacteriaceae bacterium]MBV9863881.1 16S rRNA (adenine(1518)-N(6)/adenine(1519)-N(6))-dimethyltransferase RsmA [Abditibacteriaceae bacterium]